MDCHKFLAKVFMGSKVRILEMLMKSLLFPRKNYEVVFVAQHKMLGNSF